MNMEHEAFKPECAKYRKKENANTLIQHKQCELSGLKAIVVAVFMFEFNTFEQEVLNCPALCTDGCCDWDEEEALAK